VLCRAFASKIVARLQLAAPSVSIKFA